MFAIKKSLKEFYVNLKIKGTLLILINGKRSQKSKVFF